MSAETLYNYKRNYFDKPISIDPTPIYWSKAKASELLEEWLKKVIEKIAVEENASFFSPMFVQMRNLRMPEVIIQSLYLLGATGAISMVCAKVFNLSGVLLAGAVFIAANALIFAGFCVAWAYVITQQALQV